MIFAKKSLGQNFLKNGAIINEIIKVVQVAEIDPTRQNTSRASTILEIGPGKGVLTEALLATGASVIAVEKDDRLIDFLNEKFSDYVSKGLFKLIHGDILEFWPKEHGLKTGEYKVVANIPYYITGQILRQFLENDCQPASMVIMVQKEVAERIVGRGKSASAKGSGVTRESILSVSVKAYGEPKYVRTVARGNFQPAPNVDSAVLLINNISKNYFTGISENRFFDVVKKGFGQKRKMIKGNLALSEDTLKTCNIPLKARAENLNLEQWKCLTKQLKIKNE